MTALSWVITQRVVVIPYRRFGTSFRHHLKRQPWPLKMEPIGCPETSIRNWHCSLGSNPGERSSRLLRGGSLKSHQDRGKTLGNVVPLCSRFEPGYARIRRNLSRYFINKCVFIFNYSHPSSSWMWLSWRRRDSRRRMPTVSQVTSRALSCWCLVM